MSAGALTRRGARGGEGVGVEGRAPRERAAGRVAWIGRGAGRRRPPSAWPPRAGPRRPITRRAGFRARARLAKSSRSLKRKEQRCRRERSAARGVGARRGARARARGGGGVTCPPPPPPRTRPALRRPPPPRPSAGTRVLSKLEIVTAPRGPGSKATALTNGWSAVGHTHFPECPADDPRSCPLRRGRTPVEGSTPFAPW